MELSVFNVKVGKKKKYLMVLKLKNIETLV